MTKPDEAMAGMLSALAEILGVDPKRVHDAGGGVSDAFTPTSLGMIPAAFLIQQLHERVDTITRDVSNLRTTSTIMLAYLVELPSWLDMAAAGTLSPYVREQIERRRQALLEILGSRFQSTDSTTTEPT